MRTLKWSTLLGITVLFFSCWPVAFQPFFEDRCLVSEPALVGTWVQEGKADTITFEKTQGQEYRLIYRQAEYELNQDPFPGKKVPGETVYFSTRLGRLNEALFLDLFPNMKEDPRVHNDLFNSHLVPAHTIWRLRLKNDKVQLSGLDLDWMRKGLESGKVKIAHILSEDFIGLTAPTAELQKFVLQHADNKEAFPAPKDEDTWLRVKSP